MKALTGLICLFLVMVAAAGERTKTLSFVEITSEKDASKINFPNLKELILMTPTINNLTAAMLYQLESAEEVSFIWGTVNVAYITPQFEFFRITECMLTSLTIDPSLEYQVKALLLDKNNLKAIPANFNVLKKLELFSIEDNQIETINAEVFNGMTKLYKVSLAYNKITHVDSSHLRPTVLPDLEELYFSSNKLRNVSFANWSAPKLSELHLDENELAIAQSVFEAFPKLNVLDINTNPLNCGWLKLIEKEAKEKNVNLGESPSCQETGESVKALIARIKRE